MKNNKGRMTVVFDFDGVICDSTEECLITGYNAWLRYQKKDIFVAKAEDIPSGLAEYFRRFRGFVRTADQYFAIFNSYGNTEIQNEPEFNQACVAHKREMPLYKKAFFQSRKRLQGVDIEYWMGLHRTYDGIPDNLKKISGVADVFIVTGKDRHSVKTFLGYIGIDVPDSRIYDKDAAEDKLAALKEIAQLTGKALSDIIFVDDNINHILAPQQNGCEVYMAGWGYHSEEQLQLAENRDIPVLTLEDWPEKIIKKHSVAGRLGATR